MEYRRLQHRGQREFQVALGKTGQPVFVGDHLTLFGELDRPVDGPKRLGQNRLIGRAASATDRATAAVKQRQVYAIVIGDVVEPPSSAIEPPL